MSEHGESSQRINASRRDLLKACAVAGAALAAGAALGRVSSRGAMAEDDATSARELTVAGYDYDRVKGLSDGRVGVDGCTVRYEVSKIGDMNTHAFSGPQTREVSEIGLMPFILAYANEAFRDYTLIPVFPLRTFRHKSIYIRTDRGIARPADLRGKTVATPGFSSTSLTWIRGIMQHEYGVKPSDVQWVVSSKDSSAGASGGASAMESVVPKGLSVRGGPPGKDESDLLADGEVDALFHAAEPRAFREGHPKIARLFGDSRAVEQAYFRKTGIFPIMHAVAVRGDVIEASPWLPEALFRAYSQSKQLAYDEINQRAWYMTSLPWIAQEAEATRKLMGDNYWPYGIEANRVTLQAMLQYAHEQGLAKRRLTVRDLFHASTLELAEA